MAGERDPRFFAPSPSSVQPSMSDSPTGAETQREDEMPAKKTAERSTKGRELPVYAFSIEKWTCRYGFRRTKAKAAPREAYSDPSHLWVSGKLSHPHKSSGREIQLDFIAERDLSLGYGQHHPDSIGWINWGRNSKSFEGVVPIAAGVLARVIPMLAAGKLRHMLLDPITRFAGLCH